MNSSNKKIIFWNNEYPKFKIGDLGKKPMSGTWSATLGLIKELKKINKKVKLITSVLEFNFKKTDVLVVLRNPVLALNYSDKIKTFLWCHDNIDQLSFLPFTSKKFLNNFLKKDIKIICVSQFQKKQILKKFNIPSEKLIIIRNGINLDWYKHKYKRTNDCIYTAPPNRGLKRLLKIWPKVIKKIPNATLKVFSSQTLYGRNNSKIDNKTLDSLGELHGISCFSPISPVKLATELLRSKIFIYPSTVKETSSISTIEAKAAGCAIIVNNKGALPESAKGNIILNDEIDDSIYVLRIIKLLSDNSYWEKFHKLNIRQRSNLSWEKIAKQWRKILL